MKGRCKTWTLDHGQDYHHWVMESIMDSILDLILTGMQNLQTNLTFPGLSPTVHFLITCSLVATTKGYDYTEFFQYRCQRLRVRQCIGRQS